MIRAAAIEHGPRVYVLTDALDWNGEPVRFSFHVAHWIREGEDRIRAIMDRVERELRARNISTEEVSIRVAH